MTKRKRGSHEEELVDVGLGATLAHLRSENQPSATSTAVEDDGGWTVAGGSKRRRKERADSNNSHGGRRESGLECSIPSRKILNISTIHSLTMARSQEIARRLQRTHSQRRKQALRIYLKMQALPEKTGARNASSRGIIHPLSTHIMLGCNRT